MFDDDQDWKDKFDEAIRAQQDNKYDYAEHTWMVAVEEAEVFGPQDSRLALTLDKLCEFLLLRGKLDDAASYGYRSLNIYESAIGENADELANILANLAMLAKTNNHLEEAERLYRRALAVNSRVWGPREPKVKTLLNEFANVLDSLGRQDEADQLRGTKKKAKDKSSARIPIFPTPGFKPKYPPPQKPEESTPKANIGQHSGAYKTLTHLMDGANLPSSKKPGFVESNTVQPTLGATQPANNSEPQPPGSLSQNSIKSMQGPSASATAIDFKRVKSEAEAYLNSGDLSNAKILFQKYIDATTQANRLSPDYCFALESMSKILTSENKPSEAIIYLEESLEVKLNALGSEHPLVGAISSDLARAHYCSGAFARAEELALQCTRIYGKAYGEGSLELANACHNLGTLYHVQNKHLEAREYYDKALPSKKRLLGDTHPETMKLKNALNNLISAMKQIEEASKQEESSSEISGAWRAIPISETKPGWWKEDIFADE